MTDEIINLPLYRFFIVIDNKVECFESNSSYDYHNLLRKKQLPYIVFFRVPEDNENSDWRRSANSYHEDKVASLMSKNFNPIPDPLLMDKIRSGVYDR